MATRGQLGRGSALAAIVAVLGIVWLPAEHVHATDEHEEVLHRHLAPHHQAESGAALDHQEGEARYLTSPFTIPDAPDYSNHGQVITGVLPVRFTPDSPLDWTRLTLRIVRVHDPPWTASLALRAPPALARLS